jgi:hypothetical protein
MVRFACPTCQKVLKAPDHGIGQKTSCPRCGQRLLIPGPVQVRNKTVLGHPLPDTAAPSAPPSAQVHDWLADVRQPDSGEPPSVPGDTPTDDAVLLGLIKDAGLEAAAPAPDPTPRTLAVASPAPRSERRPRSGLGIASVITALAAAGLVLVYLVVVAADLSSTHHYATERYSRSSATRANYEPLLAEDMWGPMPPTPEKAVAARCSVYRFWWYGLAVFVIPAALAGGSMAFFAQVTGRSRALGPIGLVLNGLLLAGMAILYIGLLLLGATGN